MKLINRYHFWLGLLTILIIGGWVCLATYQAGTFLSGWDTLHPEFNLSIYTQRVVFGAWQEHQGLGAPASQAHLAELPRLPLLWLLTTLFPMALVRYLFMFSMYILGGVGVYLFLTKAWFAHQKNWISSAAATLGALAYLLNLGTLQQFYVPLEMFAVHFATLGFIFLTLHKVVETRQAKWFGLFFLVQVVSAPSAHTATLFYMYNVVVFLYALFFLFASYGFQRIKQISFIFFLLGCLTFAAHAYWLLPNLYYIFNHSEYVREAKISRLFSQEAFWQNQAFGQVPDVLILKNFLFNWKDYHFTRHQFIDLLDEWQPHLTIGLGTVWLSITAIFSVAGIPLLLIKNRLSRSSWPLLFVLLIPFFFLVNYNPPFTELFAFVRDHSSILEEGLRFPFTKFSILWMFGLSIALAHFLGWSVTYLQTLPRKQATGFSSGLLALVGLLIIGGNQPALSGNLLSDSMKVTIPSDYFQLFDWFSRQSSSGRILKFPLVTYAGWNYYQWPKSGYQGAGFTWFGLPQPTMDREFDRWVATDEVFYHELMHAVRTEDATLFRQLLEKYQIQWLLFDRSVIDPQKPNYQPETRAISQLIQKSTTISLSRTFGQLDVYSVEQTTPEQWLSSDSALPAQVSNHYSKYDPAYAGYGNYFDSKQPAVTYPWTYLLAERPKTTDLNITAQSTSLTAHVAGQTLVLPDWQATTNSLPVKLTAQTDPQRRSITITYQPQYPKLSIANQPIDLTPYLATTSASLQFVAPATGSAILSVNDEFFEIPLSETAVVVGQTQFNLSEPNAVEMLQVTKQEDETVVAEVYTQPQMISDVDLSGLLLPTISLPLPDTMIQISFEHEPSPKPLAEYSTSQTVNCNQDIGLAANTVKSTGITYISKNKGNACDRFSFPFLRKDQDYLMVVTGANLEGMPIKFNLNELNSSTPYLEEMLETEQETYVYGILGNRTVDGMEFHLASLSFGSIETLNQLSSIDFRPLPLTWLAHISARQTGSLPRLTAGQLSHSRRVNSGLYLTEMKADQPTSLSLYQSYDPAWIAVQLPETGNAPWQLQILPHTRLNNWANLWLLPTGTYRVAIIYLPQLIAYGGFGLLAMTSCLFGGLGIHRVRQAHSRTTAK